MSKLSLDISKHVFRQKHLNAINAISFESTDVVKPGAVVSVKQERSHLNHFKTGTVKYKNTIKPGNLKMTIKFPL
jgi:hypothetical protein